MKSSYTYKLPENCNNRCNKSRPSKAILRCNKICYGPVNVFPDNFFGNISSVDVNEPIASVTIDTTYLHCPTTSIEFSGILTNNQFSFVSFSFTLFKTCKGSSLRKAIDTFNFTTINVVGNFPLSHSIKFKYLSCKDDCDDQCNDCCTYTLELTRYTDQFNNRSQFSINGMLCALAVDSQH